MDIQPTIRSIHKANLEKSVKLFERTLNVLHERSEAGNVVPLDEVESCVNILKKLNPMIVDLPIDLAPQVPADAPKRLQALRFRAS